MPIITMRSVSELIPGPRLAEAYKFMTTTEVLKSAVESQPRLDGWVKLNDLRGDLSVGRSC